MQNILTRDQIKVAVEKVFKSYNYKGEVYLFGAYVRGDANENSNVNFIYYFDLFDNSYDPTYDDLIKDLRKELGTQNVGLVDISFSDSDRPYYNPIPSNGTIIYKYHKKGDDIN